MEIAWHLFKGKVRREALLGIAKATASLVPRSCLHLVESEIALAFTRSLEEATYRHRRPIPTPRGVYLLPIQFLCDGRQGEVPGALDVFQPLSQQRCPRIGLGLDRRNGRRVTVAM